MNGWALQLLRAIFAVAFCLPPPSSTAYIIRCQTRCSRASVLHGMSTKGNSYEYDAKSRKSLLEKSGAVLYRKSVFSPEELSVIRQEVSSCMNKLQEESSASIAQKRLGATLDRETSAAAKVLADGSLQRLVEKATGSVCELSSHIPIEIRTYEREGAGMPWHVDDTLYDPPQIEVVWTLENDSDCTTMWKEEQGGITKDDDKLHSVETEPNSAILLSAGGASHCVTHLKHGKRVILKCAYVKEGAAFREGLHKNQFDKRRTSKKKQRSSGRR